MTALGPPAVRASPPKQHLSRRTKKKPRYLISVLSNQRLTFFEEQWAKREQPNQDKVNCIRRLRNTKNAFHVANNVPSMTTKHWTKCTYASETLAKEGNRGYQP
eukprot:scaffold397763_cov17-Prasinocladus_malaysianus.AAC.1